MAWADTDIKNILFGGCVAKLPHTHRRRLDYMPTYEYECIHCGYRFERFHGMSEKVEILCPLCGKKARRCITSVGGFILKGSGFYQTDYKNKKEKKRTEEEKK